MLTRLPIETLPGLALLKPEVYYDQRGYFMEAYHAEKYRHLGGIEADFVQDNQSLSKQGTVRGLHYQLAPYAQAKLVWVVSGAIWDVVVDLRKGMHSFGRWQGFLLSSENHHQLFIAKGFAHGFIALCESTLVTYKCDAYHRPDAEQGIYYRDPILNIPWEDYATPKAISRRDAAFPLFAKAIYNF